MKQTTLSVLLNHEGKLLLWMKKRGFGMGKWNGLGDKVSGDETVAQAFLREIEEEAGIVLTHNDIVHRGVLHFYFDANAENAIYVVDGKWLQLCDIIIDARKDIEEVFADIKGSMK